MKVYVGVLRFVEQQIWEIWRAVRDDEFCVLRHGAYPKEETETLSSKRLV